MYSYVFIRIHMYSYVFICIHMYSYVFICIHMYISYISIPPRGLRLIELQRQWRCDLTKVFAEGDLTTGGDVVDLQLDPLVRGMLFICKGQGEMGRNMRQVMEVVTIRVSSFTHGSRLHLSNETATTCNNYIQKKSIRKSPN